MAKRVLLVAIILAALLVMAAPAMAFNGMRADYTPSSTCAICHTSGPGDPIYTEWSQTKHGTPATGSRANGWPTGSTCTGCHSSNLDPTKAVPTPGATSTTGAVSWVNGNVDPSTGEASLSENLIGCSMCHQSQTAAHAADSAALANPDICGQCHSRYAYSVDTYEVSPIPTPTAKATTLIQPQMALGFTTMGSAPDWEAPALSTVLNVAHPGWAPTPNPSATSAAALQTYWKIEGEDTVWQQRGHDGSASQYPEWVNEGHADALTDLRAAIPDSVIDAEGCLKCHSTDYRLAPDDAKPTAADAKYGITCAACHTPHEAGTAVGVWDEEMTPQLRTDNARTLCVQCHTAELDGDVAVAGTTVFNGIREIMNGVGAIDVPAGAPSVHKGKCVQCHMPPTAIGQGGANHTFMIIEPVVAAGVDPVPTPSASPTANLTMAYSACTTCHSRPGDAAAQWLQDTIDDRAAATLSWDIQVEDALAAAAGRFGFLGADNAAKIANANTAFNAIKDEGGAWNADQLSFQKAFTNHTFAESDPSGGVHNWTYSSAVLLKALDQANGVSAFPEIVTFWAAPKSLKVGKTMGFSGAVATSATGTAIIQVKSGATWKTAKTAALDASIFSGTIKMTKKGTFYYRATFPASETQSGGSSVIVKVVVK